MNETTEYRDIHGNRQYKDSLFRMPFREKKYLLELYNAVNGTSYTNEEDLEITTLENVLYISMKNDVSILFHGQMQLYEHQSSKNENMPLRGFLYFARFYENYILENGLDLFSSKIQQVPTPRYIVFYNGEQNEPDERTMRLSDAFIKEGGCLECEVKLLNINYGRNRELMKNCRRLEEYAIFIATVRKYQKEDESLKKAITLAIDECIEMGILLDILTKQRNEVQKVVLETFNRELYEKNLKEDAYSEGKKDGIYQGKVSLIKIKLAKGKTVEEIADDLEESVEEIQRLIEECR